MSKSKQKQIQTMYEKESEESRGKIKFDYQKINF